MTGFRKLLGASNNINEEYSRKIVAYAFALVETVLTINLGKKFREFVFQTDYRSFLQFLCRERNDSLK